MTTTDEKEAIKADTTDTEGRSLPKSKGRASLLKDLGCFAVVVLLVVSFRCFVMDLYVIPSGSMAPTVLGEHKDVWCPNCGWYFALEKSHQGAYCPNCEHNIDASSFCPDRRTALRMYPLGGDWFTWLGIWDWFTWLGIYPHSVWCPHGDFKAKDAYNRIVHGGNRILANKLSYDFWSPQRWDVMVFTCPQVAIHCQHCGRTTEDVLWHEGLTCPECGCRLRREGAARFISRLLGNAVRFVAFRDSVSPEIEEKNFIKRVIGLPGEKLEIKKGDIYINGKIARKPPGVQDVLWFPCHDSTYIPKEKVNGPWKSEDDHWALGPNRFEVKAPRAGPSLLRFQRDIDDRHGYAGGGKGQNVVGDIKISFDVTLADDSGGIEGKIRSDSDVFGFHLRSPGEKAPSVITRSGGVLASDEKLAIHPRKRYHIDLYNVDAAVGMAVDGVEILRKEYEPRAAEENQVDKSGVAFGVMGGRATFTNVKVYRDVYYTEMSPGPCATGTTLGKDEYFALGDNSPKSKDSRVWGTVPAANVIGKALVVFWAPADIRLIR